MPKQERNSRHNVLLYPGDMDRLKTLHPNAATVVIRALVRRYLNDVRAGKLESQLSLEDNDEPRSTNL